MGREQKGSNPGSIPTEQNCSELGSLRVMGKGEGAGEKLSGSSLRCLLPGWLQASSTASLMWPPACGPRWQPGVRQAGGLEPLYPGTTAREEQCCFCPLVMLWREGCQHGRWYHFMCYLPYPQRVLLSLPVLAFELSNPLGWPKVLQTSLVLRLY